MEYTAAQLSTLVQIHITEGTGNTRAATRIAIMHLYDQFNADGKMVRGVTPEGLELIKNHPMMLHHNWLIENGFRFAGNFKSRKTYLPYVHDDDGKYAFIAGAGKRDLYVNFGDGRGVMTHNIHK